MIVLGRHPVTLSASGCVTVEDKVASLDDLVAGKAGVVHRLVGGFTVVELSEPPAVCRGVLFRVLDYELNSVLGWPGHERLATAKGFFAFLQRVVTPGEPGNDRAVRERKLAFAGGLDRDVVAQDGAQIVEVAFFMGHGDQPPVAVSGGNFDSEDRGGLLIGLSGCGGHRGDHAGERCNCNQRENNPSHPVPPSNMQVRHLTAAMMRRLMQPELPQATCWSQSEHAPYTRVLTKAENLQMNIHSTRCGPGFPVLRLKIGRSRHRRR